MHLSELKVRLVTNLSDEVVQQIWAEAYHYYKQGEGIKLDAEAEKVAEADAGKSHGR